MIALRRYSRLTLNQGLIEYVCYGIDMGADHIISRNLWLVWHNHLPWLGVNNSLYFSPADWSRP